MTPGSVRRVHVRLLPWRPRWRSRKGSWDGIDVPDLGDDPISLVLSLVLAVVFVPALVLLLVGVLVLSVEVALVLALIPFAVLGQLLGLLPWYLLVTRTDGSRQWVEAGGTREMLAARRHYRSLRPTPA